MNPNCCLQCLLNSLIVLRCIVEDQIEFLYAVCQSPDFLEDVHLRQDDQIGVRFMRRDQNQKVRHDQWLSINKTKRNSKFYLLVWTSRACIASGFWTWATPKDSNHGLLNIYRTKGLVPPLEFPWNCFSRITAWREWRSLANSKPNSLPCFASSSRAPYRCSADREHLALIPRCPQSPERGDYEVHFMNIRNA